MAWLTGGKHMGSKPLLDTNIRNNQTVWEATGLEKARSHSNYLMDELMGQATAAEIAASGSAQIEWCGKASTVLEGNRYMQVILDVSGTPSSIWFQLPSHAVIAAPDSSLIEKCCCEGEQTNEVLTAVLDVHTELEPGGYTIYTTGSKNGSGVSIEEDSNYRYTDTYELIPDGVNSLGEIMKISALGGQEITFDWTNSLVTNTEVQASIEFVINGTTGYMDGTSGYQIPKDSIQERVAAFLSNQTDALPHITGGQWKITRTVELVSDSGVNGSDIQTLAQGITAAKYSSPKDVARFAYNSGNSTGLFVADHDNNIVSVVYDLENTPVSLTAFTYASNVLSVMVDESEEVNGFPALYVLLSSGQIRKLTRNIVNDYLIETNNWLDTLIVSLAPGPTFATIDPTRTGSGGTPIFFVGMESAYSLLQVVQDTGGGYVAASLEDTGSVLDSAGDAYQVEDIQIHSNGDLYYILRGQDFNLATAVVLAQNSGDIATPGDWTHTIIAGSLTARGDAVGDGTAARFDNASGLFITGNVDTTGPIIHIADRDNHKLKKLEPTSGQAITNPANWTVTHVAGDGTQANDEGSGTNMSLPDMVCGHYYADTDELYIATDLFNKIMKISGISAGTYDQTNVVGVNAGQVETVIW